MADKIELPQSIVTKLVKEGAAESLKANYKADNGVIVTKDSKEAY